ncbi:MAG: hypothetical protein E7211_00610 [Clostridium lundense]|nr:hypothetical protein [Clostridium lundense]
MGQQSPVLGLVLVFWYYQRKDYNEFINKVQEENNCREKNLQEVISKNQDIISDLTEKFDVVEDVKKDVEEIKVILKK